jgi:hypothetical protein
VALDVHTEDVSGVQSDLVSIVREFDATGLSATAHLHLRFDHYGVTRGLRGNNGLVNRGRYVAGTNRDSEAREVLLALVLEQVHVGSFQFWP